MIDLLIFEIGDRRLAILASVVQEIVRAVTISVLPKAPPIVEGVINVRGAIVPVLDIRARFNLSPRELSPDQQFILAHAGRRRVALRVDRTVALVTVDERDMEPSQSAPGAAHVLGIAKLPDEVLVIHDLATFLSLDEAAQIDEAHGKTVMVGEGGIPHNGG